MNDPGLDEPIAENAKKVEDHLDESDSDIFDDDDEVKSFLLPARWWYASTAFPMIAGTFGPMANTFSICALVQYWRVEIPPKGTEGHGKDIKDPTWLLAVNAVSLAFAVTANISLSLNMAQRLSFSIAQPITIIGYWIASILLIALVAVATHDFHAPGVENQALSQAYYYAIFAAGLYQVISYLMCVTVWGAYKGHYSKEFKLTMSQRTLMLQTISFMAYLLVGAAIFSKIEGWRYLDAIYWADFTCLTVGIGDYAPMTHLGRGLLFPYAIGGIVSLGLVVGSIRSLVLDRGKKKVQARMTEKTRKAIIKRVDNIKQHSTKSKVRGLDRQISNALDLDPTDCRMTEIERRKAEFHAMRAVQELSATKRKWISLGVSGGSFLLLWLIGALVFYKAEKNQNWTYFDGLYFAYTTLLTIGYGDLFPQSNSGKPFFVFWTMLAVPALTILISDLGDTVVKAIKEGTIYVGELTFLPSDQGGITKRLKHGLCKISGGKMGSAVEHLGGNGLKKKAGEAKDATREGSRKDPEQAETMPSKNTEGVSKERENESRQEAVGKHDPGMKSEHHYRHLLASEIKKMYAHVNAEVSKQFTYDEWTYYLRLLGEDEHDERYHRRALIKVNIAKNGVKQDSTSSDEKKADSSTVASDQETPDAKKEVKDWSWLGNRSPLMGDKDEAEWILERLLVTLERDLKSQVDRFCRHHSSGEDGKGKKYTRNETERTN